MSRPRPWPLEKLAAANRNAIAVYAALRWLAGDARKIGTTRLRIRSIVQLSEKRITAAVHTLDEAGWLALRYGRAGKISWYRITFPVGDFFPVRRKATRSKRVCRDENDPQQTVSCAAEKDLHSRKGVRGGPALECGDPAPEPIHEHPSARIERERMAQIRAAREQRDVDAPASPRA